MTTSITNPSCCCRSASPVILPTPFSGISLNGLQARFFGYPSSLLNSSPLTVQPPVCANLSEASQIVVVGVWHSFAYTLWSITTFLLFLIARSRACMALRFCFVCTLRWLANAWNWFWSKAFIIYTCVTLPKPERFLPVDTHPLYRHSGTFFVWWLCSSLYPDQAVP